MFVYKHTETMKCLFTNIQKQWNVCLQTYRNNEMFVYKNTETMKCVKK